MLAGALLAFLWASPALAGVDNPTPANFLRRPYANAVVLGDYVYIDGGELAQLEDGEYNGDHPSYAGMYNGSRLHRNRTRGFSRDEILTRTSHILSFDRF